MSLHSCSFCGKRDDERRLDTGERVLLIVGPAVTICEECVELCNEVIAERRAKATGGA